MEREEKESSEESDKTIASAERKKKVRVANGSSSTCARAHCLMRRASLCVCVRLVRRGENFVHSPPPRLA